MFETCLPDQLSSGNFSSGFNMAGLQNSQGRECDASSTICSESAGEESGNFENSLQCRTPVESEINELETEENGLDYCCKAILRKLKNLGEKVCSSEADTDSSSDESMSLNKYVMDRFSYSARNKSNKYFEHLRTSNSRDIVLKSESSKSVTCRTKSQLSQVLILQQPKSEYVHPAIPQVIHQCQNMGIGEIEDNLGHEEENVIPEMLDMLDTEGQTLYEDGDSEEQEDTLEDKEENGVGEEEEVAEHCQENLENQLSTYGEKNGDFEALIKAYMSIFNLLIGKLSTEEGKEIFQALEKLSTYEQRNEDLEALIKVAHNILIVTESLDLSLVENKTKTDEAVEKAKNIIALFEQYSGSTYMLALINSGVARLNRGNEENEDTLVHEEDNVVHEEEVEKVQSEGKAGTRTASQIRELLLHKEKQQAERQKVQMKVDRLLEILKDSENEKNEKKDDIKERQDNEGTLKFLLNRKMKQIKKFVAYTLLIKECIKQLENSMDHHMQSSKFADKHALTTIIDPDLNMNVEEKVDTTADHEQNVEEEQEQVTAISEENGENEETVKSLGMFPTTDLAQYMPRNIPRENVFPHQDVSQGERSCLTRKSDYIERKAKNLHPSDYPNENESYWHRQDMQRASHISEHERRRVPNTVRSNKAQSAKNMKKAENRVKERNYLNTQTEEKRRKLINRSTLTDHVNIMGFKSTFKTLFADKGIKLSAGGGDAARLMPEHMLCMLSDDWMNILPEEMRNKFINRSKSIHPEDSSAHFKLLADITNRSEKTGEKPIECRRGNDSVHSRQERNGADVFFDELFPGHQMFSMKKHSILVENHFQLLYEIATLPEKTGEKQKEIEKVRSEDKADTNNAGQIADPYNAGQIADTETVSQIRELMLHKEEHQAKRQKVQMNVDRLLEILKDSENEKNEKENDIKELQQKMKQSKKFVVRTMLIKERIKQLKVNLALCCLLLGHKTRRYDVEKKLLENIMDHHMQSSNHALTTTEVTDLNCMDHHMQSSKFALTTIVMNDLDIMDHHLQSSNHALTTTEVTDLNMNVEEKVDTTAHHEQNVEEEQEQVTAISEENGENEETVKSLGMFPTTDPAPYMPRNIPRENVFPHQDVSQGERSCLTRKSDYIERKAKNLHPSDYPNENESYWHRQDMQRASHISEHERQRVPNTVRSNQAQSAKNMKKAENRVKERNYLNTQTEEKRRKLINRSTLTDHVNIMGFKSTFKTLFADKGIKLSAGGGDAARLMPEHMLCMLSDDWMNILPEEMRNKFINRSKSIHPEDSSAHFKLLADITNRSEKTGEKPIECRRGNDSVHSRQERNGADVFFDELFPGHQMFSMKKHSILVENHFQLLYEIATLPEKTGEKQKEIEKVRSEGKADTNNAGQIADPYNAGQTADTETVSQIRELMLHKEEHQAKRQKVQMNVDRLLEILKDSENEKNEKENDIKELQEKMKQSKKFVVRTVLIKERIKQLKNSMDVDMLSFIHALTTNLALINRVVPYLNSMDHHMQSSKVALTTIGVKDLNIMDIHMQSSKFADKHALPTTEETDLVKNAAAERRSTPESTQVRLYRNVMRNETCRMMTGIDMVVSEAKQLFGVKRTRIFFDLLDDGLFHFGSAGAILDFVPNMAESTVRQHVISFFECASDTMNRLMTLLLGCPDSKKLQQMPEQNFITLIQSVIDSSLKTKTKGGKSFSSKGSRLIMVATGDIEKARDEEIPGDVLDRLRHGDEMVVHSSIDTERRENKRIPSIYFPSDCRLFISIPTEFGSYWYQLDRQRVNRISRHGK